MRAWDRPASLAHTACVPIHAVISMSARSPGPCGRAPSPANPDPITCAAFGNSRRSAEEARGDGRSGCPMDKLEEALARLERAVALLEAASAERPDPRSSSARQIDDPELREIAGEIAARVDGALARIGRILGGAG